jgi:hypothetical protein
MVTASVRLLAPELGHHAGQVHAHRLLADVELGADLAVGAPIGDEREHRTLARGEHVLRGDGDRACRVVEPHARAHRHGRDRRGERRGAEPRGHLLRGPQIRDHLAVRGPARQHRLGAPQPGVRLPVAAGPTSRAS